MTNPNQSEELRLDAHRYRDGEGNEFTQVTASCKCGRGGWIRLPLHPDIEALFQDRLKNAVEEALGLLEYDGRYDLLSDYQRNILIKHHKTALAQLNQSLEEER